MLWHRRCSTKRQNKCQKLFAKTTKSHGAADKTVQELAHRFVKLDPTVRLCLGQTELECFSVSYSHAHHQWHPWIFCTSTTSPLINAIVRRFTLFLIWSFGSKSKMFDWVRIFRRYSTLCPWTLQLQWWLAGLCTWCKPFRPSLKF